MRSLKLTALWLTKDRADTMELVQITLAKAYRVWHRSVSESNLKVTLFRILTTLFFDGVQRKTRISIAAPQRKLNICMQRNRFGLVEGNADISAQRTIVRSAIEIRYVRILSRLAGFSNLEIAKIIGINQNAMESGPCKGSRLLHDEYYMYGQG